MLKKVVIVVLIIVSLYGFISVYATTGEDILESDQANELITIKEGTKEKIAEYVGKYGSTTYGLVAYILNVIRIYSIPFCFIGIAGGSIFQYVIGIRKLDVRDKGLALIVTFVTILAICQVLPLVFTIVVMGWRG